jgi:hypothetical protein
MLICEKNGKFVEAEMTKQRVAQFKKFEITKNKDDLKSYYDRSKQIQELEQKMELDKLNEEHDLKYKELTDKYDLFESDLKLDHERKFEEFKIQFMKTYKTKPSVEMLNLTKMLNALLKIKK